MNHPPIEELLDDREHIEACAKCARQAMRLAAEEELVRAAFASRTRSVWPLMAPVAAAAALLGIVLWIVWPTRDRCGAPGAPSPGQRAPSPEEFLSYHGGFLGPRVAWFDAQGIGLVADAVNPPPRYRDVLDLEAPRLVVFDANGIPEELAFQAVKGWETVEVLRGARFSRYRKPHTTVWRSARQLSPSPFNQGMTLRQMVHAWPRHPADLPDLWRASIVIAAPGETELLDALIAGTRAPGELVRRACLRALRHVMSPESVDACLAGMRDESQPVRETAWESFRLLTGTEIEFTPSVRPSRRRPQIAELEGWWSGRRAEPDFLRQRHDRIVTEGTWREP